MVTLAVSAILLGIGVPAFNDLIASNRLTTQTNELVGALHYARSEALKRNRSITLCRVSGETDTGCPATALSAGAWTHWIITTGSGQPLRRGTLASAGSALTLRADNLTNDRIAFGPDGLLRSGGNLLGNNARLRLCASRPAGDNVRLIGFASGGRISTEKGSASACSS